MTRQNIVLYGDEVLRKPTSRVLKFDKSLRKLVEDMFETMYASEGVGLAAPQIGVSKRVLVLDVDYPSKRYINEQTKKEEVSYSPLVLINPILIHKEGQIVSKEGCLSFPNVFFDVLRFKKIIVKYQDLLGKERTLTTEDNLFCRCIQHEIDHLDGKLFIDKAADEAQVKQVLQEAGLDNPSNSQSVMLG